jgi:RNA polymerase sigma-70 factor (ECF subfamily)
MPSIHVNESIEAVIERYKQMIFGIALSYTKCASDADDVFQEVFITYYNKNISYHDEEHRKAWLIRTAINCAKRVTGSTWRKKTVPIDENLPVDFEFRLEEENLVFHAMSSLPHKYRIVIHLFYFEELSVKEIASILKIKEGTVKVQLTRGRNMLRDKLKGDYFYES